MSEGGEDRYKCGECANFKPSGHCRLDWINIEPYDPEIEACEDFEHISGYVRP